MKKGKVLLILVFAIVCVIAVMTIVKSMKKDEGETNK